MILFYIFLFGLVIVATAIVCICFAVGQEDKDEEIKEFYERYGRLPTKKERGGVCQKS